MFGKNEFSSLTWDSAAWIYSVIIGVVIVRYFTFIANLLQEPKSVKIYYPYLAFLVGNIFYFYNMWYTARGTYTELEGKTLIFGIRSLQDIVSCVCGLILVPKDRELEDFFDMKLWLMKIKKVYFLIWILSRFIMGICIFSMFFIGSWGTTEQVIGMSVFMIIMLTFAWIATFSTNDYYLSFFGTIILVQGVYMFSNL